MDDTFLLYGAYGYTGELIVRMATDYGLRPILAGRNEARLKALADRYQFEYQAFSLDDTHHLTQALQKVPVVLHAAGPFTYTAQPMMEACLETKTHYLDITGEIEVFELAQRYGEAAEQNEIMVMPGVGFDVVPTDCMAKFLQEKLPDATHLQLAFAGLGGGASRGTALTMVENLGEPSAVRQDGRIKMVPLAHKAMEVPFMPDRKLFTISIPWGDVSTAYHTTGIPNIETYMGFPPRAYRMVKLQRYFNWLMRTSLVKNLARRRIRSGPAGPTDEQRANSNSLVWGKVWNAEGQEVSARMRTLEGYTLTATTSLMITKRVLEGNCFPGYQTPAGAYGEDLIMEVEGTQRELIND